MSPLIRAENLGFRYGERSILEAFNFEVNEGSFVSIVGPSGCGKTSLLGLLAGRLRATHGQLDVPSRTLTVYQEAGLYPWLNLRENLALAGLSPALIAESEMARGLDDAMDLFPRQVSGGMRRKVELLRALYTPAPVLLLDEPFAALDALSRLRIQRELRASLRARPKTVVMVTHDIDEAIALSDAVFVVSPRPMRVVKRVEVSVVKSDTWPQLRGEILDLLGVNSDLEGLESSDAPVQEETRL